MSKEAARFDFGNMDNYVAGGAIPDGDYCWKELEVQLYQAETKEGVKKGAERLGVMITMVPLSDPTEERKQFYSFGSKAHLSWEPTADGKGIQAIPGGPSNTLPKSTNWALLVKSLYDCGLPQGIFGSEMSTIEGVHVHMSNVPEPEERKSFKGAATGEAGMDQGQRPGTVAIVSEIKDDGKPWEGTGGVPEGKAKPVLVKGKVTGAGKASPTTAKVTEPEEAASDDDTQTAAINAITVVLSDNADGLNKLQLRTKTFAAIKDKNMGNAVLNAYFKSDGALSEILGTLGYKVVGANVKPA